MCLSHLPSYHRSFFRHTTHSFRHTTLSPSYPAKAGYPVRRGFGDRIERPEITGSSAFADDDGECRPGVEDDNATRIELGRCVLAICRHTTALSSVIPHTLSVIPRCLRHTPRRRGIQYAAAVEIVSRGRRLLDHPPSRTMTANAARAWKMTMLRTIELGRCVLAICRHTTALSSVIPHTLSVIP